MRRKLWPKAHAKEGTLGQMPKNFQVYFIHMNLLRNQKKIYNRAKESYCDATIFVFRFFIVYLPKKMKTEKWPNAADSPLHIIHLFSCENFSVLPVIFIHKVKNKNFTVRFQQLNIPVKRNVDSLNYPNSFFSLYSGLLFSPFALLPLLSVEIINKNCYRSNVTIL